MTYIVCDTETTGLLKADDVELWKQPHLTEIFAYKLNNELDVIGEFSRLIKPPIQLPEIITKLTGITEDMLADKPSYLEIRDDWAQFCLGSHTFVAHNATFDMGMLITEEKRMDTQFHFPWPMRWHCTVELSYPIKNRRLRLKDLNELATGDSIIKGAHRAENDVKALLRCYQWLIDEGFVNGNS